MNDRDDDKTNNVNSHSIVDETSDRTFRAIVKPTAVQSGSSNTAGCLPEPGRVEHSFAETRTPQDGSGLVTLHLPEPINAALQGSQEVFRHFVKGGWDANAHSEGDHDTLDTVLEGLCGSSVLPLALRHTVSTPCIPNVPASSDYAEPPENGHGPPIELDPFQRSTSTPANKSGSFGTARSAFTLTNNSFVDARSQAPERRHSISAFGPADFYSLALQDAVEQASIEVEHRPEETVSRFLSSNVRILRRRKSHEDRPLPVTVLEHPRDTSQSEQGISSEELGDENPNNTSTVSQLSELSGILPIADSDELDDSSSARSTAHLRDANAVHRQSPPLTPATVSSNATLGLSTTSETDREVAEATSQARRNRREVGSRRFLALLGDSPRDGATLPVERFLHLYPSPLLRYPTSSTTSTSLQSTTTGRTSTVSSHVSSSRDPPTFVSYLPSEDNVIVTNGPSESGGGEASPAADFEPACHTQDGTSLQYHVRSRFVTPHARRINDQGTEVAVVPGPSPDKLTTVVITPEKEGNAFSD